MGKDKKEKQIKKLEHNIKEFEKTNPNKANHLKGKLASKRGKIKK
jgi:hypothetical protein